MPCTQSGALQHYPTLYLLLAIRPRCAMYTIWSITTLPHTLLIVSYKATLCHGHAVPRTQSGALQHYPTLYLLLATRQLCVITHSRSSPSLSLSTSELCLSLYISLSQFLSLRGHFPHPENNFAPFELQPIFTIYAS